MRIGNGSIGILWKQTIRPQNLMSGKSAVRLAMARALMNATSAMSMIVKIATVRGKRRPIAIMILLKTSMKCNGRKIAEC